MIIVGQLVGNVVRLVGVFAEVALSDPLSAILLLTGGVLTLFSVGFFGYLVAGAVVDALIGGTSESIGRSPPPEAK